MLFPKEPSHQVAARNLHTCALESGKCTHMTQHHPPRCRQEAGISGEKPMEENNEVIPWAHREAGIKPPASVLVFGDQALPGGDRGTTGHHWGLPQHSFWHRLAAANFCP